MRTCPVVELVAGAIIGLVAKPNRARGTRNDLCRATGQDSGETAGLAA